jgi:hypothetical protein
MSGGETWRWGSSWVVTGVEDLVLSANDCRLPIVEDVRTFCSLSHEIQISYTGESDPLS